MSAVTALLELPTYFKKLVDAVYGLTVAATNVLKLLEGSGLNRAAVKAVLRRLRALTSTATATAAAALPGADAPDPHTASLPGVVYADYAGAPPYSISALRAATADLLGTNFYGNPHSDIGWGAPTASSSAAADHLRHATLALCRADPARYVCVLTAGATSALKLVGEAFPWGPGSAFLHLDDNHNSVLGIREMAAARGAATGCVRASSVRLGTATAAEEKVKVQPVADENEPCHLLAYPLESNFSGVRYSETLTAAVQGGTVQFMPGAIAWHQTNEEPPLPSDSLPAGRWRVLIDAAKAASTAPPDLSAYPADFVALSFYKIFGYPTGLGALIVRRDALDELRKAYFSGGTVEASLADERFHALRQGAAGLEDGTLSFLALPAALRGLEAWDARGGAAAAHAAGHAAAAKLAGALLGLRHANGAPVCAVYGLWADMDRQNPNENEIEGGDGMGVSIATGQGPTVTFSVLDSARQWVGHRQVQRIASLEGVMLRSGAMCNPGACCAALGVGPAQARAWHAAGHVCWDDRDVMDGQPTGAVRASFGWGSTLEDATAVATAIARHFVDSSHVQQPSPHLPSRPGFESCRMRVHAVTVYPLKSAAGFSPRSWPLGPGGLLHDRRWAVVDAEGAVLTQRRCPALARVKPVLDLEVGVLRLHAHAATAPLEIPLDSVAAPSSTNGTSEPENAATGAKLCGKEVPAVAAAAGVGACGSAFETEAAATRWLHEALGLPSCRLVEHSGGAGGGFKHRNRSAAAPDSTTPRRGFANEAQMLVVTVESLRALQTKSGIEGSLDAFATRFRPNLVIEDDDDFFEAASASGSDSDDDSDTIDGSKDGILDSNPQNSALGEFEEESWQRLRIGDPGPEAVEFEAAGPCPRCEMVCLDPKTGQRAGPEPLLTLARARRAAGRRRLCFGVLMNLCDSNGDEEGPERNGEDGGAQQRRPQRRVAVGMPVEVTANA